MSVGENRKQDYVLYDGVCTGEYTKTTVGNVGLAVSSVVRVYGTTTPNNRRISGSVCSSAAPFPDTYRCTVKGHSKHPSRCASNSQETVINKQTNPKITIRID